MEHEWKDLPVSVEDLPGIGRRYDVLGRDGGRLAVVIHRRDGEREVFAYGPDEEQAPAWTRTGVPGGRDTGAGGPGRRTDRRSWRVWPVRVTLLAVAGNVTTLAMVVAAADRLAERWQAKRGGPGRRALAWMTVGVVAWAVAAPVATVLGLGGTG